MNNDQMFESLVRNALDFLFKAISEVNDNPKYSVIHFYSAVELFLKARLMKEHWTLVISKNKDPDWEKFISGDFHSVSLDEAAIKLKKVVRSGLSSQELEAFKAVSKDRNKMVHFFHKDHDINTKNLTQDVVKKQLKAWHFLHQLLIDKWTDVFSKWSSEISELDLSLRKLHQFLQVIFDGLQDTIENMKKSGAHFRECPSCGFESQECNESHNVVYDATCLVCGLVEKSLNIACPDCGEVVTFKEEGFSQCGSCGKNFEPEDLANELIDDAAAHIAAMDGDDSWEEGNCSFCDGYHTVVRTENDEWICAGCLSHFESLSRCGWCNEPNTGNMEHSYVTGCHCCDGLTGWHRDD